MSNTCCEKKPKHQSIRSPLGRARGLGPAKDGVGHWCVQRFTAIALIPLTLYILWAARGFLPNPEIGGYAELVNLISQPFVSLALIATAVIACYHAALGVQVIIEDYIHCDKGTLMFLILNKLGFLAVAAVTVYCILYITFGIEIQAVPA